MSLYHLRWTPMDYDWIEQRGISKSTASRWSPIDSNR